MVRGCSTRLRASCARVLKAPCIGVGWAENVARHLKSSKPGWLRAKDAEKLVGFFFPVSFSVSSPSSRAYRFFETMADAHYLCGRRREFHPTFVGWLLRFIGLRLGLGCMFFQELCQPISRKGGKLLRTGSTIAPPPQNQRFSLTNVSGLLDTRKDTLETKVSTYFLVCKGLSIDDVGMSRDTVFQEIRPGVG